MSVTASAPAAFGDPEYLEGKAGGQGSVSVGHSWLCSQAICGNPFLSVNSTNVPHGAFAPNSLSSP